jgi:hypothetical protein
MPNFTIRYHYWAILLLATDVLIRGTSTTWKQLHVDGRILDISTLEPYVPCAHEASCYGVAIIMYIALLKKSIHDIVHNMYKPYVRRLYIP